MFKNGIVTHLSEVQSVGGNALDSGKAMLDHLDKKKDEPHLIGQYYTVDMVIEVLFINITFNPGN